MNEAQYKKIAAVAAIFAAIGAVVGLVSYLENRKTNATKKEIAALDLEIKKLDLKRKQKEA